MTTENDGKTAGRSPAKAKAARPAPMTWGAACDAVAAGRRVTRAAWAEAGSPDECVFLHAGLLHLRRQDGTLHRLVVGSGDIEATDWGIVEIPLPFTMPPTAH